MVEIAAGMRAVRNQADLLGLKTGTGVLEARQNFQVKTGPGGPVTHRQSDGSGDPARDRLALFEPMELLADLESEAPPPGLESSWQKMMSRFREEVTTRSR